TESAIADNGFVPLADPQAMILPQNVVPLMRSDVAANPQVTAALDPVQAALTTEELTALNKQVDVDKMDPNEVAGAWLKSKGLA
ncbi:MAG: glycine betaine ABC transporter substrate-binding protein, partial [Janthinobacterium lividum]